MCHLILLLPVFALSVFWVWPLSTAGPVYIVIAALSLWMYVYIWRAMRRPVMAGAEELLHSTGEVVEVKDNALRVRIHSEIWNAVSSDTLAIGAQVRAVGINGLVLRVEKINDVSGPD